MAHEPKTLTEAVRYFEDANNCLDYLVSRRWPNGVICPTCGRKDVAFVPSRRLWQCKTRHAKAQFSIKTGTILEDSPLGLDKWLPVIWLVANCKNGISSWEVCRALGVTQKTAWFMLHRIRLAMQDDSIVPMGGNGMPVEVDETFIGGRARNMHADRKRRMRIHEANWAKTVVVGMLERRGKVRAQIIPERTKLDVHNFIKAHAAKGAEVITDEFKGYMDLPDDFIHQVINHADAYVRGHIHTNSLENFWSLLKRGLNGTYVAVEPFHLFRYMDEQMFRFNNRATKDNPINDADRFSLLCSQIVGKRLTYAELTAKDGEKPDARFF